MERILVTGASGLVGSYFCRLDPSDRMFIINHSTSKEAGELIVDLRDLKLFAKILEKIRPDVIVHLAAITDVDRCDDCKEDADRINHMPLKVIAKHLEKDRSCFAVYVSTDYVFEGATGSYSETDSAKPLNWYGTTKLYGERELIGSDSTSWCIARTSTPFGVHEKKESFPLFIVRNLSAGKAITIVKDQVTSPTWANNLAMMLAEIVRKRITGIIHTCGRSAISRYDQAVQVASTFGLASDLIAPISVKDMRWKAARPMNSSLSVVKAMKILDHKPMTYEEGLAELAQELKNRKMGHS